MADEVVIYVEGMDCGHCVLTVTEALSAAPGVTAIQIESTTGRTVVTGHALDQTTVRAAVARADCSAHGPRSSHQRSSPRGRWHCVVG